MAAEFQFTLVVIHLCFLSRNYANLAFSCDSLDVIGSSFT
jgi:hypothetical protein